MSSSILVAKRPFSVEIDGTPRSVKRGETFREGHPIVEGREHLFKPFTIDNEIEQATAGPGEKRNTRIRKSKPESTEPAEADTGSAPDTTDYSEMKQPELKALLDKRGIEYPTGVVSNADLIALLSKPESTE